jgi:hypothetical protein
MVKTFLMHLGGVVIALVGCFVSYMLTFVSYSLKCAWLFGTWCAMNNTFTDNIFIVICVLCAFICLTFVIVFTYILDDLEK